MPQLLDEKLLGGQGGRRRPSGQHWRIDRNETPTRRFRGGHPVPIGIGNGNLQQCLGNRMILGLEKGYSRRAETTAGKRIVLGWERISSGVHSCGGGRRVRDSNVKEGGYIGT